MSLRVSDFDQYLLLSDRIDFVELRLGEAKVVNLYFTIGTTPPSVKDITGWTFSVSYKDATALVNGQGTILNSVSNFNLISLTPQTDPNLAVTVVNASLGQAVLSIPATITSVPALDAPIDGVNTLLKLITIQATYSTNVPSFNAIDKYAVGGIIRFN